MTKKSHIFFFYFFPGLQCDRVGDDKKRRFGDDKEEPHFSFKYLTFLKWYSWIGFMLILTLFPSLYPLTIGSTTTPSRQAFVSFPSTDSNNQINAFAWMEGGFNLASATTTCTFDSVFPVSGHITLNGGGLYLSEDLWFNDNNFTWTTGGAIFGNGYSVILPKFNSTLQLLTGANTLQLRNTALIMNSPVQFNQNVNFIGACRISGNTHQLTIPAGVTVAVNDGGSLTLENLILNVQGSTALSCLTNNAAITMRNCTLLLSSDYNFPTGSLSIQNSVHVSGMYKFIYSSGITSTIASNSLLFLDQGVTFSYSPSAASKNLLLMQDSSSYLYLNGCTLYSTITGLRLDIGTVFVDNNVTMTSEGRNSGESAEIGGSLNMNVFSEAVLNMFGNFKYV